MTRTLRTRVGLGTLTAILLSCASASGHPGGVDSNGGHVDRSTGNYHCHRERCVLPTSAGDAAIHGAPRAISIVSFNIQFLGNFKKRDNEALAAVVADKDIVVIQELVAPPYAGTFPDGSPYSPDEEAAAFFEAMQSHGFEYVLSEEDTGSGPTIHSNASGTEWWVVYYKPAAVSPAEDIPHGFLAEDRSDNPDYERVPYGFAFRTKDSGPDFVLISVHLQPNASGKKRRAHELSTISKWVEENDQSEHDFIILGDMNIENCDELQDATPPGFISLNISCMTTNTNTKRPKPYDHVMYRPQFTAGEIDQDYGMKVINLVDAMKASWHPASGETYPGDPYNHDRFRQAFSDHNPVVFRMLIRNGDDD